MLCQEWLAAQRCCFSLLFPDLTPSYLCAGELGDALAALAAALAARDAHSALRPHLPAVPHWRLLWHATLMQHLLAEELLQLLTSLHSLKCQFCCHRYSDAGMWYMYGIP